MCKIIDALPPEETKLSKAFAAASLYYNYSQTENCFNIEHGSDSHGLHGWDWQVRVSSQLKPDNNLVSTIYRIQQLN